MSRCFRWYSRFKQSYHTSALWSVVYEVHLVLALGRGRSAIHVKLSRHAGHYNSFVNRRSEAPQLKDGCCSRGRCSISLITNHGRIGPTIGCLSRQGHQTDNEVARFCNVMHLAHLRMVDFSCRSLSPPEQPCG